jgi:hypothetical protein
VIPEGVIRDSRSGDAWTYGPSAKNETRTTQEQDLIRWGDVPNASSIRAEPRQ